MGELIHAMHEITVKNRNTLELTGVISVESFDSEEFLLQTEYGYLGIRGQELHIKNLDLDQGKVALEGHIFDISYLDAHLPRGEKAKNLLGKIFK